MRKIFTLLFFSSLAFLSNAQNIFPDSLKKELAQAKNDTARFSLLSHLAVMYTFSNPDSAMILTQQTITLAKKIKTDTVLSQALRTYAGVLSQTGNYSQAIYFGLESLKLVEKSNDFPDIGWCYSFLAATYIYAEDYEHALFYTRKAKSLYELHPNLHLSGSWKVYWDDLHSDALVNLAFIYDKLNLPDSALEYLQKVRNYGPIFYLYGNIYFTKGDYAGAISYYRKDYQAATEERYYAEAMLSCNGLAKTFHKINLNDSSIFYAKKALELNNYAKYPMALLEALDLLENVYKSKGNNDSTLKYLQLALFTKDSLFNQRKIIEMQSMTFNEQLRQQDIANEQKAHRDKIRTYTLTGGLIMLILILTSAGLIFFYRYRIKQLEKLQSVKSRIASDLHDDIGATLTNINILAELSKQNFNKTGNADPYLNRISEEINITSQALDDIIWSVNVHDESFDEVILRMRRYAGELFDADKINYTIRLDEKLSSMKLSMEQRRDLYLLFKESVNNIHKHAAATNVSISITGEDHNILMEVEDDGKGFCMKETPRNGLKNMQSRVQKWKGEMRVETTPGKGTQLLFIFPAK
jgi:signal transduction histidine kinase